MIRGIILDVDGVLVGGIAGYNWPDPHPDVISALKKLRQSGMPVVLCTGKGTFAIESIVKEAHLDNPHIGDGGAVIVDILAGKTVKEHTIPSKTVANIVDKLKQSSLYVELYSTAGYSIEKHSECDITKKHTDILGKAPLSVERFGKKDFLNIIKIMPVARNEGEVRDVEQILKEYADELHLQWGRHPTASPYHFGIITQKGISKGQSFCDVSSVLGISMKHFVGVGDQIMDWGFMKFCGYRGIMGNASDELKGKAGPDDYIGKSVDENGIVDIFSHFSDHFQKNAYNTPHESTSR